MRVCEEAAEPRRSLPWYSCMLGCQESRVVKSVQVILEYSWVSTSTGTKHLNFGIYEVDLGINLAACDSSYSGIQRRIKS